MKISQEGRDAARGRNDSISTTEIRAAMEKKSEEFREQGSEIYVSRTEEVVDRWSNSVRRQN
jgi:hypothetical protein